MITREVEEQLIQAEMEIVAAQKRRDFAVVADLLADDFHEIGSSGRLFTKPEILKAIRDIEILECSFERFQTLAIGSDCVIVTYLATARRRAGDLQQSNRAWRSSVWIQRAGEWRVVFHQATPLPLTA